MRTESSTSTEQPSRPSHPHSHAYVSTVESLTDAEMVAVADENDERGQAFAVEHRPTEEVLDTVDAGIVCAANSDRTEWARSAANAGVDVLCEKPLAPTAEEARGIVDACDGAGVALGVAMPVRFNEHR